MIIKKRFTLLQLTKINIKRQKLDKFLYEYFKIKLDEILEDYELKNLEIIDEGDEKYLVIFKIIDLKK